MLFIYLFHSLFSCLLIYLFMRQDTQYNNNKKQIYNITLSHRQLEDKPLENIIEWEDDK